MANTARPRELLDTDPVRALVRRVGAELGAAFDVKRSMRVSRAPGRLDVMGGIADYTGSMVCEMPLDRASAVAIQQREDRAVQIFSFNLLDEHKPFTFGMPLDAIEQKSVADLHREFGADAGRRWAGYLAGCLVALNVSHGVIPAMRRGMNIAVLSTVPLGAGVSSSAAIEVATMMGLADHLGIKLSPMELAERCQWAENHVVGSPCGIMDQVTCCAGEAGRLLRMKCQPHELLPALELPAGIRVVGIDSNVKHDVSGPAYTRTRCAAFMGHRIVLEAIREMGAAAGREMTGDPMGGYLANLDPDDYKALFRSKVPDVMNGREFLERYGTTIDTVTSVEADVEYQPRHATDHHVLEARRVRRFSEFIEAAGRLEPGARKLDLDRAGHLMYASHQSYGMDAMLGAPECDVLVDLVRRYESQGLYGARITGGGSGGTVAVLCEIGEKADAAIERTVKEYGERTGRLAEVFWGSSDGAMHVGTEVVR